MITADEIRARIAEAMPGAEVDVRETGGGNHFEARVISPSFQGRSMVEQHQLVYAPLTRELSSGELHALALKTYTPEQWAAQKLKR